MESGATAIASGDVELIDRIDRLGELEGEWRRLAVGRENAFVTPEWFFAWWRHYGEGHVPLAGAVWAGETLRGILPLVVSAGRGRSTARFAGSGLGDHFHPVCGAADETGVAIAVAEAIHAAHARPPAIVLENVDSHAAWWRELGRALGVAPPLVDRESTLPSASLAADGWDQYLARRSRNLRSQIGRRRRALERDHEVRVRSTEAATVEQDIATLFRLHDARWASRAGESSLRGERARRFHADFAAAAQRSGWLRLCFLELDGEAVAGWYGWRVGGRYAYYQAGFDPAWAERSVGFVLFTETIRAAVEEGVEEYDMLLGDEPFKLRFADSERPVCTAMLAPRLRPVRVAAAAESRLRRTAHRLPERVRMPLRRSAGALLDRLPLARRR